jgi:acetyl esterase/lipase
MKIVPGLLPRGLFLLCLCALSVGCTSAAILAANGSVAFGPYDRSDDIAYGPDQRQTLDVYVPDGESGVPRPVVVFFHGGGWSRGSKDIYRFVGSALAEKGAITVIANYRLTPEVRFPVFVEDAASAVAWTFRNIADHGGDPARIFLMGHSAGAHISALLALDPRYLARDGIDTAQLAGVIGLSGPYDFAITAPALESVFGKPADPADTQPVRFVRADAPPVLLLHGTADRLCRYEQSIRLAERLTAAGGQAEVKLYPDRDHTDTVAALSTIRRTRAPTLEDVAAFIGGICAPSVHAAGAPTAPTARCRTAGSTVRPGPG